ncbi:MAG TPA: hypothetical protein DHN33_01165 [Eubacteriaceae bacterium]|nr:hypothetical protein [Eubacteriaceae bacterium]
MLERMSYKARMILIISVSVIIIIAATNVFLFKSMEETIIDEENMRLRNIAVTIDMKSNDLLEETKTAVLTVASNPDVQQGFAQREREQLLAMMEGPYQAVSDKMAQFQFHLPDSTSFLRLHAPEKFGDSLRDFRFTVNQANETESLVAGIEEGRGGYGFRVVSPVSYEGTHVGTVEMGADLGQGFLEEIKSRFTNGDFYIYSLVEDGLISWEDQEHDWIASTADSDEYELSDSQIARLKNDETIIAHGEKTNVLLQPFTDYSGEVIGYYKAVFDRSANIATMQTVKMQILLMSVVGIGLLILITYLIVRSIFNKIDRFKDLFAKLSLGDLTVSYPLEKVNCSEIMDCGKEECPDYKKDGVLCWFEVGSYAPEYGREVYCSKILNKEYKDCRECKVYKRVNKNEIDTLGAWFNSLGSELSELMKKVSNISQDLSASSQELQATGTTIANAAENIGNSMESLSSGTEEQSAQAEETSEVTEKLTREINQVDEDTDQMKAQSDHVKQNLQSGQDQIHESVEKINTVKDRTATSSKNIEVLGESSKKIGEIVTVIGNIAEQTNLLALNAAIEAARAGEAGKGFSVVAEEVRKLAEESSGATDEIAKLIKSIQAQVSETVDTMDETEEAVSTSVESIQRFETTFEAITDSSERLEELIDNIAQSAKSIAENSNQVAQSIDQIAAVSEESAKNVQDVALQTNDQTASTQEIVGSSEILANMAGELTELLSKFKYE